MLKKLWSYPTHDDVRKAQLESAKRELLHHEARVEEHAAGVAMYRQRIARLEGSVVTLKHPSASGVVR